MTARKHRPAPGLFDPEALMERVAATDHVLWRINALVEWDRFLPTLKEVFPEGPKELGGRPRYDLLLMFKVMVLKHLYNLPDEQLEQRLLGDMFFRHFLGLTFADPTPDQKTIWLYHDTLCEAEVALELFEAFNAQLHAHGVMAHEGRIVDATIVPVPVQRISKEERDTIKRGEVPQEWKDNPSVLRQRDTDAAWVKKNGKSYFGYKNHVKMDKKQKLIQSFEVTPANDHDGTVLGILLDPEQDAGQDCYADAAYVGAPNRTWIKKSKMRDRRHFKAVKNGPLNTYKTRENKKRSKVRARVEHAFGAMKMKMGDLRIRSIGLIRVTFVIGMRNIVYNMCRFDSLKRLQVDTA
jgi:IS5 family transposase